MCTYGTIMSVLIPTMIGKHHLKLDMPGEFSNKVLQKCLTTTSCSMRGWWKSRNRAVENPTAFTRNPMKRFQTPTSRNPVMVRRRAENRTWRVRKSILLKYGNLTVYRNTEIKTIYLHSFHSNPIRDIFGGKTRRKGMEWGKEFNGTTRNFAI